MNTLFTAVAFDSANIFVAIVVRNIHVSTNVALFQALSVVVCCRRPTQHSGWTSRAFTGSAWSHETC